MGRKIFFGFLIVFVAFFAISMFLPTSWHVERSITINAGPEKIHPLVNNLRNWEQWTPWNKELDPSVSYTFQGPKSGIGAKQIWKGDKVGEGSLIITESDPTKGISYDLFFDQTDNPTIGTIHYLQADENKTQVTWTDDGKVGMNPLHRYMGLLIERWVGAEFEKGLAKLKRVVEAN